MERYLSKYYSCKAQRYFTAVKLKGISQFYDEDVYVY